MSQNTHETNLPLEKDPASVALEDARIALEQQGISPDQLTPAEVVFATKNPRELDSLTDVTPALIQESGWADYRTKYSASDRRTLDNTDERLARPARRRAAGVALVIAAAVGGGFLAGAADTKEDIRAKLGVATELKGNAFMGSKVLTSDESILPGDTGQNIPIVGWLAKKVPGIPDFGSLVSRELHSIPTETTKKFVNKSVSVDLSNASNPVAPDLELTGAEYENDKKVADQLFEDVDPKNYKIDSLNVVGLVSDELDGQLGEPDLVQKDLATKRALVAAKAVVDAAKEKGISIDPKNITLLGYESVLSQAEVDQVTKLASKLGLDSRQLISNYNAGMVLPKDVGEFLNTKLGKHRGADIKLSGTKKTIIQRKVVKYKDVEVDSVLDDLPGEVIVLPFGGITAFAGLALSMLRGRRNTKVAHRAARRKAKRAGFDFGEV